MVFRRRLAPESVRRAAGLVRGERLLAEAETSEGRWILATTNRFVLFDGNDSILTRAWCDVDRASFDPVTATQTVRWVDGSPDFVASLANPRLLTLARVVRERVEASMILSETVETSQDGTVRVAVRRDSTGSLFSQVIADGGIDLSDPMIAAAVDTAESRLRIAAGLAE